MRLHLTAKFRFDYSSYFEVSCIAIMMDDPSLTRQTASLVEALAAIEKSTSGIKRSTTKLASARDIAKERRKVRGLIDACTQHEVPAVYDALKFLDKYLRLHPDYTNGVKLAKESRIVLASYQLACDNFYTKCCDVEAAERKVLSSRSALQHDDEDGGGEELSEKDPFLGGAAHPVSQRRVFEQSLHDEIVEERNREVREIAESVRDINEIFTHINEILGEQGEKLQVVDEQISASERATKSAAEQLRLARDAQDRSRRNQVILLIIVVIVVGIVVAVMTA